MIAILNHWTFENYLEVLRAGSLVGLLGFIIFCMPNLLYNWSERRNRENKEPQYVYVSPRPVLLGLLFGLAFFGWAQDGVVQTEHKAVTEVIELLGDSAYFQDANIQGVFLNTVELSTEDCTVSLEISGMRARVAGLFQHTRDDLVVFQEDDHQKDEALAFAEQWCTRSIDPPS